MTVGAPILDALGMRAAEQAMFDAGTDPYALMVRAGEGAADMIWRVAHRHAVLVLCGPGNNGGDGYVIARALRERGVSVRVAATGAPRTTSAIRARDDWAGPIDDIADAVPAAVLVDALFGVGQNRPLEAGLAARLRALTDAAWLSCAVDLPSGIDGDSGALLGDPPGCDIALAIGAWKPAHVLMPAAALMRRRTLIPIGVTAIEDGPHMLAAPRIPMPPADSHKYRRGLAAVVAGAMPGAAVLAAEAAARGGAGYVRLVGAEGLRASHALVQVADLAFERARALLVGPGLGRDEAGRTRLDAALAAGLPIVIDADALALLDGAGALPSQTILTPHGGEFDALFGADDASKITRTCAAARRTGAVVVHKGSDTVIAAPDGRTVVAPPASHWLSTAGTGDVLAGLCAARLAVTGDAFRAACEGVWLHGEAARRAGAAFIADDLVAHIPAAIASRA